MILLNFSLRLLPKTCQMMLFSATYDYDVMNFAEGIVRDPVILKWVLILWACCRRPLSHTLTTCTGYGARRSHWTTSNSTTFAVGARRKNTRPSPTFTECWPSARPWSFATWVFIFDSWYRPIGTNVNSRILFLLERLVKVMNAPIYHDMLKVPRSGFLDHEESEVCLVFLRLHFYLLWYRTFT